MGDTASVWGEILGLPKWLDSQGLVTCARVPARSDMLGYGDLSKWLLWPGVALMVTHSLTGVVLQAPDVPQASKKHSPKKTKPKPK